MAQAIIGLTVGFSIGCAMVVCLWLVGNNGRFSEDHLLVMLWSGGWFGMVGTMMGATRAIVKALTEE